MMEKEESGHVRRVRYKGTHPRIFKEKYKELQPELYADDIAKIIGRGHTPAGMHRSICVAEIMDILNITPGQKGFDATLGYGGHSLEILKRLRPGGKLYATDVDPVELPRTHERLKSSGFGSDELVVMRMNFAGIDRIVAESGQFDFILADLGVSSMQIDNPERGFSFKAEGPLDLRLNPQKGKSAATLLKTISQETLEQILIDNSDEPFFRSIAQGIVSRVISGEPLETTIQLQTTIAKALEYLPVQTRKDEIKKACQRCFQALRIEVNNEFGVLDEFLDKLPYSLVAGGRVAILTFHSGEDRRVKKSFQELFRLGIYKEVAREPIRPSAVECFSNPRARSAKLRWAIRA